MTYTITKRRNKGGELLMKMRAYKTGFTPLETMGKMIPRRVRGKFLTGFTLIEMVVVVAIIAILVSMVVTVAKRIEDQGKEKLCRETIALVGNALEQFRDFGFEYKDTTSFAGLTFPLDCNGYDLMSFGSEPNLPGTLRTSLYPITLAGWPQLAINGGAEHDPCYSGCEALYFILSQVPDCRMTLGKIDKSLLTNKGKDNSTDITINIQSSAATMIMTYPFTRIIDPWGTTLRYDYYPEYADYFLATGGTWSRYITYRNLAKKTFPVITSAGPDKQFDTSDDITNIR